MNCRGFGAGDTDRACDFLKKALASDPAYAHARLNLAKWYIEGTANFIG